MNAVPLALEKSREPSEISSPGNASKEDFTIWPVKHDVERPLVCDEAIP